MERTDLIERVGWGGYRPRQVYSTVSGDGRRFRQQESFVSLQGWDLSMGELGSELGLLVGFVVDVIRGGVELDSGEQSKGFDLDEISRSVQAEDASDKLGYLGGGNGVF